MYDGTILFNYITRILFLKTSTDMYGTFTNRWPYRRFPTHTYFNQRPANITASLPQGGRPGGLSAAQTSIFFGGETSAQKYIRRRAFSIPTPAQKYIRRRAFPIPTPAQKIHTAGAYPSLSPTLGKQWSHSPSPT